MKLYTLTLSLVLSVFAFSQQDYLIVNNDSISIDKFKKEYKTNIEAEGVASAMDAYINFTLLNQAAKGTQLDTMASFKKLYAKSLQPLKEKYLTHSSIEDSLKKEIWSNLQNDLYVEIYAIGIENKYDKSQVNDRLSLINELYATSCNKAKPTADVNNYFDNQLHRELWIRPFTISSEIETVAYNTPIGKCSEITASDNGNFFVKVIKERPSTGITTLDYIYNTDKDKILQAKENLLQGEDWTEVKNQFNEYNTLDKLQGKKLFQADIPLEIYHALTETEEYSSPIALNDGFYLIRKNSHKTFNQFNEWDNWLSKRIKESDYSLNYVRRAEKRAMQLVDVKTDPNALNEVLEAIGKNFFQRTDSIVFNSNKTIWSAKNMEFTQLQLLREINTAKKYFDDKTDTKAFLEDIIPKFKRQFALNVYITHMPLYEPELASEAAFVKNSILLDSYLENEIYQKAKLDTLGQKSYLEQHQNDFLLPRRFEIEMYTYNSKADGKKIYKLLRKGRSKDEILPLFINNKQENGALSVVRHHGEFKVDDSNFGEDFNPKEKLQFTSYKGKPVVLLIKDTLPQRAQTFEEAGYLLKEAYTKYYYELTLHKLRENATITVPSTL